MISNRPETCSICHQKAYGHSFNVVCCNACKMFLRRFSSVNLKESCVFQGTCFTDKSDKRPVCKPCRLQKCYSVGMRSREVITSPFITQDHINSTTLQNLSILHESRLRAFELINITEDFSFCDLVARESMLGTFGKESWNLEEGKLKPWMSLGIVVVVEMCKAMDFYKELLLSDRVLLLKSVAFKSNILSISYDSYHRKKSRMLGPSDIEMIPPILNHIPHCQQFIDKLLSTPVEPLVEFRVTRNEYLLLNMIVICNPGIPGLSPTGQKTLSVYQQLYLKLLLDHCLITDSRKGPSRFSGLLMINSKLEKSIIMTRKFVFYLRTYWNPGYLPCQLTYDSCGMDW